MVEFLLEKKKITVYLKDSKLKKILYIRLEFLGLQQNIRLVISLHGIRFKDLL